jgi:peptidoglycan/xylan/chitin deacetylase (PgdA/CDA1 family)
MRLLFLVFLLAATPAFGQQIALTFDDLPSTSDLPAGTTRVKIAAEIIAALKAAHVPPVTGFVNGVRLHDDPASAPVLKMWRAEGWPLGNHTYSHISLSQRSLADWEADVLKNEAVIAPLMRGRDWRWLRFPYLEEGETLAKHDAARAFLAAHGYRVASVTIDFDDWQWDDLYPLCVAKHDAANIAKMETTYLAAASDSLAYFRGLSQQLYGRDIPYVLLMHLGSFDARMLPRLLALYQGKGVHFITLEEAEADPFYAADTDPRRAAVPVDLEQALIAKGVSYTQRDEKVMAFDTLCK